MGSVSTPDSKVKHQYGKRCKDKGWCKGHGVVEGEPGEDSQAPANDDEINAVNEENACLSFGPRYEITQVCINLFACVCALNRKMRARVKNILPGVGYKTVACTTTTTTTTWYDYYCYNDYYNYYNFY